MKNVNSRKIGVTCPRNGLQVRERSRRRRIMEGFAAVSLGFLVGAQAAYAGTVFETEAPPGGRPGLTIEQIFPPKPRPPLTLPQCRQDAYAQIDRAVLNSGSLEECQRSVEIICRIFYINCVRQAGVEMTEQNVGNFERSCMIPNSVICYQGWEPGSVELPNGDRIVSLPEEGDSAEPRLSFGPEGEDRG